MRDVVLTHLEALVGFDTRNPPRAIGTDGIFDYLRAHLHGFQVDVVDHGAGAVSMIATRGRPTLLFNVHLDTVPASQGWTADPLTLRIDGSRAIALGACDIKGAAACLLAASHNMPGDAAFLFTTDEEANDPRCISAFLARDHGFTDVLVAEPTRCEAVLAHRGISSALVRFSGEAGHASSTDAMLGSAVHRAMRWGVAALEHVNSRSHERFGGLTGLRFNIGTMEGGIKGNVIAPSAQLRVNMRPLPSVSIDALHEQLQSFATHGGLESYTETFRGPPLPSGDIDGAERARLRARDLAEEFELTVGNAVDFWTEAALFSQAGLNALVFGPGDIAQAHSADEFVEISQLERYAADVATIIGQGRAG